MPMPTMRAGDVIIAPQGRAYPHGYSLLANIEMGKTRHFGASIQLVDMLFKKLGTTPPPCATARAPLPGAASDDFDAFRESFKTQSPLPPESTSRLLKVYGTRAPEVLRLASSDDELRRPISDETASVGAEVVFAFRDELAETLVDCLMRRTMTGLNSQLGLDAVGRAARVAQKFLGWDEGRAAREIEDYERYVERFRPQERQK